MAMDVDSGRGSDTCRGGDGSRSPDAGSVRSAGSSRRASNVSGGPGRRSRHGSPRLEKKAQAELSFGCDLPSRLMLDRGSLHALQNLAVSAAV